MMHSLRNALDRDEQPSRTDSPLWAGPAVLEVSRDA
jgi:hypothetical protein